MRSTKALGIAACVVTGILFGTGPNLRESYAQEGGEIPVRVETGLYYTVEKGDTLWDLSEQFYDTPWVWPDLWKKNENIANPHWIYPGQRLRFYSREELEKMGLLPAARTSADMGRDKDGERSYYYPAIDRAGFVRREPVSAQGFIFGVEERREMIGQGDHVYIRPEDGVQLRKGDRFSVFRTLSPMRDPDTGAVIGVQHYIVGLVEIEDVQPKFATGSVLRSFRTIEVDDRIMPYQPRSPRIPYAESQTALEGQILASEEDEGMFGDLAVVFVDKGSQDGMMVGQQYSVYYQDRKCAGKEEQEPIEVSPVEYGRILILRVEETTATALVTMSRQAIHPKARIHAAR